MNMKSAISAVENMDISDFDEAIATANNQQQRDLLVSLLKYKLYVRQSKIIREDTFTI